MMRVVGIIAQADLRRSGGFAGATLDGGGSGIPTSLRIRPCQGRLCTLGIAFLRASADLGWRSGTTFSIVIEMLWAHLWELL